jgi:hypothetical protein
MTSRCGGARDRAAAAQSPAFAQRGAVTDLDGDAGAIRVQFHPERVGFVEIERLICVIVRSEHVARFTSREHVTAHVGLLTLMVARSKNFLEHFVPILHWLIVHPDNDVLNNRRSDAFVGQDEVNGPIGAIELEDWPHRGAHLLALHMGGVTRNTQSQESYKGCDHYVVSAGATRLRLFRHAADHIAGRFRVNRISRQDPGAGFEETLTQVNQGNGASEPIFIPFVSFCSIIDG